MAVSAEKLPFVGPEVLTVDAAGVYYRDLNRTLRKAVLEGAAAINVENVFGQRYIGTNLRHVVKLRLMDGPEFEVFGNAQDGVGNTMNSGGTAQDFFGEYMAGGTVILLGLGLKPGESHKANFIGTGMHGGRIYVRGGVSESQLGKEVGVAELDEIDRATVERAAWRYCALFGADADEILSGKFVKLYPKALRPYGRLYAY